MRTALIIAGLALLLLVGFGGTMSKAEAQYICSPMSGTVMAADGQPAGGASVRREWIYNSKSQSETATTDAGGRFSFDGVPAPRKGWFSGLSTPVVVQRYYVTIGGADTEVLYVNSRSLDLNHETGGAGFDVICDLSQEPGNGPLGWGVCRLK